VVGLAAVSPAQASTTACSPETLTTPFDQFNDFGDYFLVPGSDFVAAPTGWQFDNGAAVVADPAAPSGFAAELPPGASVTTPAFCVSGIEPTARMFGLTVPDPLQHGNITMGVRVIYSKTEPAKPSARARKHRPKVRHSRRPRTRTVLVSKPLGRIPSLSTWTPTRKISLSSGRLHLVSGQALIRYQFTAPRAATWRIDDLYVDPHMKR
jgi:hypothetical protein